ncbi:MAG: 3-phosphoshikimate 1-carboxyvinyltransferase [Candidatus Riflebacteria bacterium]|nr:3-phosphoshikimate 1-carboxyvinyltransferase [Candidatus Riflebacteria bacterium]
MHIKRSLSDVDGKEIFEIVHANHFEGQFTPPGDKSISHRALILGALASGISHFAGCSTCLDVNSTRIALTQLGIRIETISPTDICIHGAGGPRNLCPPLTSIDCGNSGTTARLLLGLLPAAPFESHITGDASLRQRPMGRVLEPLRAMGAHFAEEAGSGRLPLRILGPHILHGLPLTLAVPSAQVKSAILLAGAFAEGETTLTEPWSLRDHTERLLSAMNANFDRSGNICCIRGGSPLNPVDLHIPGDPSAAAFLAVAAAIHPGSRLIIRNVSINPTRLGFLDVLRRMGTEIRIFPTENDTWEPIGEIEIRHRPLSGTSIGLSEVPGIIDELPVLAVAMALADGSSHVTGAGELRVKESDRISTLVAEFRAFGIEIDEHPDGYSLYGKARPIAPKTVRPQTDHRIAMALTILGTASEGVTQIGGIDCIAISFPNFAEVLGEACR